MGSFVTDLPAVEVIINELCNDEFFHPNLSCIFLGEFLVRWVVVPHVVVPLALGRCPFFAESTFEGLVPSQN